MRDLPDNRAGKTLPNSGMVVLAVGRAGMGKGGFAQEIASSTGRWKKRFCASPHFSNDFLSIVDAAARYLAPHPWATNDEVRNQDGAIERLAEALVSDENLCIIGGLERLLVPMQPSLGTEEVRSPEGDRNGVAAHQPFERFPVPYGSEATLEFRLFCEKLLALVLSDGGIRSDVLLTTAVIPNTFRDYLYWMRSAPRVRKNSRSASSRNTSPRTNERIRRCEWPCRAIRILSGS